MQQQELFSEGYANKLQALASDRALEYRTNRPFPHIYFDRFLPETEAEQILNDFPEPQQLPWQKFDTANEKKLAFDQVEYLPPAIRNVLYFLNSRPMLSFLETLTGIAGIIPDPYYSGGGLHQIKRGGKLDVHADFNFHNQLKLDRRINVLIYLNKDWEEAYGGHFELWNRDMSRAEQKILPLFNRCAIFSTTSYSYHGHPTPLACPPDRTRKSLATYYYSNGRPREEVNESHSTLFQRPLGTKQASPRFEVRHLLRAVTPPVLFDACRKIVR
jgi:Rps23 Pro-64 3,4-dihydroxylase Tpa1-like proline 4-hydroxylase